MTGSLIQPRRMPHEEVAIGHPGGHEIGRAVSHVDEVGRMDWTGKCRDARPRQYNGVDLIWSDIAGSGRIGGGFGERMTGMPARHELDSHVRDDIPLLPQVAQDADAVRATVDLKEPLARFENALFRYVPLLCRKRGAYPSMAASPA